MEQFSALPRATFPCLSSESIHPSVPSGKLYGDFLNGHKCLKSQQMFALWPNHKPQWEQQEELWDALTSHTSAKSQGKAGSSSCPQGNFTLGVVIKQSFRNQNIKH